MLPNFAGILIQNFQINSTKLPASDEFYEFGCNRQVTADTGPHPRCFRITELLQAVALCETGSFAFVGTYLACFASAVDAAGLVSKTKVRLSALSTSCFAWVASAVDSVALFSKVVPCWSTCAIDTPPTPPPSPQGGKLRCLIEIPGMSLRNSAQIQ